MNLHCDEKLFSVWSLPFAIFYLLRHSPIRQTTYRNYYAQNIKPSVIKIVQHDYSAIEFTLYSQSVQFAVYRSPSGSDLNR